MREKSKEYFNEVEDNWDIYRLYSDLAIKGSSLSKTDKRFLNGLLLGYSPIQIANICCYEGRDASKAIRVTLSRNIYPCIITLLELPEKYKIRWDNVPELLFNYRRIRSEKSESLIYISKQNSNLVLKPKSDIESEALKKLLKKNFMKRGFTEDLLNQGVKTMDFRKDWQFIVNRLVGETRETLRAMVFDTELQKWWSSLPGIEYMATNAELLRRNVDIKRIFIFSSTNFMIRKNAIKTAYLHDKIGIDVRVVDQFNFGSYFFDADMFSVHDNDFAVLYYLNKREEARIITSSSLISNFISFYTELFADDKLCKRINDIVFEEGMWAMDRYEIEREVEFLKRISSITTMKELVRII